MAANGRGNPIEQFGPRYRVRPGFGFRKCDRVSLLAVAAYLIAVIAVGLVLPTVNEVPDQFPAVVLWQFRVASLGAPFGALTERAAGRRLRRITHGLTIATN